MRFDSPSPEATFAAGRALAGCLDAAGLLLALAGPLGAGKTLFVKGLAAGLGIEPEQVASPTFVIASEYPGGTRHLAHLDLYRVESEAELEAAGFLDLLRPGAVIAVEWADRLPGALPAERLDLRIERSGEGRRLEADARGDAARRLLERWRRALGR